MINDSYVTQNMIANLLPASQLKVKFACTLLVSRGGSRISGKGVHMCEGVGNFFADFILFFLNIQ